ncbi:hypothetical protein AAFF_G00059000 [Aldrovandia affinis]|uniref:Uncharacterized protein n=1 Tax=Aldrovandia affinis TaxID=143900 RepID=A0AAD7S2Q8_9TELE|nr:hypothetical protein AAFF_G00059000 [Aldrovandia affinis]
MGRRRRPEYTLNSDRCRTLQHSLKAHVAFGESASSAVHQRRLCAYRRCEVVQTRLYSVGEERQRAHVERGNGRDRDADAEV